MFENSHKTSHFTTLLIFTNEPFFRRFSTTVAFLLSKVQYPESGTCLFTKRKSCHPSCEKKRDSRFINIKIFVLKAGNLSRGHLRTKRRKGGDFLKHFSFRTKLCYISNSLNSQKITNTICFQWLLGWGLTLKRRKIGLQQKWKQAEHKHFSPSYKKKVSWIQRAPDTDMYLMDFALVQRRLWFILCSQSPSK